MTGELVPEHEWTAGHERAAMARGKVMHVGAADSHAANLDEHLAGRRNRIGSLFRAEVSFSVQHVCDHVVTGEILPEPAFNFKFFSCSPLYRGPPSMRSCVALKQRFWVTGIFAALCACSEPRMVSETPQETKDRPNIVFILADDMGYGDVGAYNPKSKIPAPNINDLAQQGMRFTDAHSPSAVCSPTRYAVLTGRYAWRTWLSRGVVGGYTPPLIEPARPTVASFLKDNGYTTAMIGKWHLGLGWVRKNGFVGTADNASDHWRGSWQDGDAENGMNVDFAQPSQGGPTALGFDYAYFTSACSTIDGPFCYIERDRPTETPDRPIFVDPDKGPDHRPRPGWIAPGFVLETVDPEFTASAIDFMKSAVAEDAERPFFVYLALSSPHAPWLPPTFVQGASEDGARGDLVVLFDWAVGEIVAALEDMGLADDTLVIVTSDNGPRIGTNGHASSGELRGYKSHAWEGGHRVPFMARWPGRIEAGTVSEEHRAHRPLRDRCVPHRARGSQRRRSRQL